MRRVLPLLWLAAMRASAQCVMCFRTAEAQNMARARVLNAGIILLGTPPFLILAGLLVLLYRRSKVYSEQADSEYASSTAPMINSPFE